MRDSLARLQLLHRLEEVGERFGLHFQSDDAGPHLSLRPLTAIRGLDRDALRQRAEAHGLRCDEAIRFTWDDDPARAEDALLGFLEALYQHDPRHFLERPPRTIQVPESAEFPRSTGFLERFYGDDFLPREKKPVVVDLRLSRGPFLRSVDDDALQIIDAASQIASHAAGFRPGRVQAALDEGRFDPLMVAAHSADAPESAEVLERFRDALLEVAPPCVDHVCFVNSGAEANEKALHIARMHGPGGRRIIAFEGSFHGRTLLSLFSTWNPVKRGPYEIPGFETQFFPLPVDDDPYADPPLPEGWRAAWATPHGDRSQFGDDPLLRAEIATLEAIEASFAQGDLLGCLIEPYQCEGGDRSASRRFFHGLRALTRAWRVPLIMDEVQSGFGLGGDFFWHQRFDLLDAEGRPDGPDLVVGAKRAQLGYVLSRWPDPDPAPIHAASALRGRLHLELVQLRPGHARLTARCLHDLARKWSDLVTRPRSFGDAFAFDMPSREAANHLIGQRFYRGYMVYIAGERTLRYRMNRGMREEDVRRVFEVIDRSLDALVQQAGGSGADLAARIGECTPPKWDEAIRPPVRVVPDLDAILADETSGNADRALRALGGLTPEQRARAAARLGLEADAHGEATRAALRAADPEAFLEATKLTLGHYAADALGARVHVGTLADFDRLQPEIDALEDEAYGPDRRDATNYLRTLTEAEGGVFLYAEDPEGLVGMAFGAPIELWPSLDGPRQDPQRGRQNTLYSADLTVAERARGHGIGYRLRLAMIRRALQLEYADGRPRYAFITGRNKFGEADAMWALNQRFGAYQVALYSGQYGAPRGLARYYRLPLRRHDRRRFETPPEPSPWLDCSGVHLPTGASHPLLERARSLGVFDEGTLTKLTVSNFITAPYARYAEYLRHVAPKGTCHLYFTSCVDEMVDKTLRALKYNRRDARVAIGLSDGELGTTTAAARSLSAPGGTDPRHGFFGWPLVPHPADGLEATLGALDDLVEREGADGLFGLFVESVQARTGRALSAESWAALCDWRDRTGVPLVLSETTTGLGRNGAGRWWIDGQESGADAVLWWAGGQIGHIFTNDRTYVAKPLQLISTWDGDELSATRLLWQMYALNDAPIAERAAQLEDALKTAGLKSHGMGLYRVVELGESAEEFVQSLALDDVMVGRRGDAVVIAPPLTIDAEQMGHLAGSLARAARGRR